MFSRILVSSALVVGLLGIASGQEGLLPKGNDKPFPRPQADGPTSFVTAAALSPDGKTLYVGGWDKVVHVWRMNGQGQFVLDRAAAYRVPIGPGLDGSLNALALSDDGAWLAVAGHGMARGSMSFHTVGVWLKRYPPEALKDRGLIYVFNTRTRAVKLLRGHEGQVYSLAFAPGAGGDQPPRLVSFAQEWLADREDSIGFLRAWDVDQGTNLATIQGLPKTIIRPGLAVWRSGQELQAAVACDDGKLRVWNVNRGAQGLNAVRDGQRNNTVEHLGGHLLTCSMAPNTEKDLTGWLQAWTLAGPDGLPKADANLLAAFPPIKEAAGKTYFSPRALTLFAGKPGGPLDHAAVILRTAFVPASGQASRPEDDRLQIVRLEAGKLTRVLPGPVIVARGGGTQPVVAASAGGRHLVVAGNRSHAVLVFAIDHLLKGQVQPQVLRSVGQTIRYVGFVRKDKERGLLLNPAPTPAVGAAARAPAAGDLIFDIGNRKLIEGPAGWQADAPAAGAWQVTAKVTRDAQGKITENLLLASNGKVTSKIVLKDTEEVTDYAIVPGAAPLLALATHNLGLPQLAVHNLQTGDVLQRLTGHTERIRGLAVSGDAKLLASAAEDQIVSVWSLADATKVLGKYGTISGLQLGDKDQTVVVEEVDAGSPANGKLKVGDVILGIVEDGKLKPADSSVGLFLALWQVKPGQLVTLRLKRGDVAVMVEQGGEVRNPLFSLLVTRPPERDWLGWSPTGPYDVSRDDMERHLGWHINTGKAEAPTRFAEAGEYKKEYHRPDILKYLAAKGNLAQALEEWDRDHQAKQQGKKLPEPQINLRLAEAGPDPLRRDGEVVVRQAPQMLRLAIDNFANEDIGSVTWTIAGLAADPRPFTPGLGREWTADVSTLPWKRGGWRVQVELQTREDTPRKYVQELALRYQPPAPEVTAPTGRLVVDKPDFTYKASVKPGAAGQDVQVRLSHRHGLKELLNEVQGNQIDRALKLQPGDNLIEVVATNKGVPAEYQDLETTRRVVEVTYQPPVPDPQPIVTLESVVPLGSRVSPALPIVPGRPVVVDAPKVLVRGKIAATKNLTKAEWAKAKDAATPLAQFKADRAKEFAIAEELTLAPGTQQFRFAAQTAKSDPANATLTVVFRPPLPQLVLTAPQAGLILYEGKDPASVDVRFQVLDYQPAYPFQASFLVNGKAADVKPAFDEQSRVLSAKVPLAHGDNRIQVRLKNQWEVEEPVDDLVLVRYLRPPRIAKLDGPAESEQSLVDLTATVESALPLVAGAVDAEVSNAAAGTRRRIATYEVVKGEAAWTVRLKNVPLELGNNQVRLLVSNTDARSLEPATRTIVLKMKKPAEPPTVSIIEPSNDVTVKSRDLADLNVSFTVASKSPLKRLELVRLGGPPVRQAIDVSKLKADKDGRIDLKLALKLAGVPAGKVVPLDPGQLMPNAQGFLQGQAQINLLAGTNPLRVEAVNEGGQTDASVVVNYLRMPVELVIDRLEPRGGVAIPAVPRGEGRIGFAQPVEQGRVVLHGWVRWEAEKDQELKQLNHVQVFVNGLRQHAVPLQAPSGTARERAFQTPLSLTGATNAVEIALPGLALDDVARRQCQFDIDCRKPESQRLHLLIVGVGEDNEAALVDQVLKGLHATSYDPSQRRFQVPNFAEGRLYPPLVGYVRPGQVLTELRRIKDEIDLLARAGATADVVLVYFAGQKQQQGADNYVLTSVSQHVPDLRRSALAFNSLEACLADTLGGQVLLMDVNQAGGDTVGAGGAADYLQRSRVGLVCFEWKDRGGQTYQLPQALEGAMKAAATFGQVVHQLNEFALKRRPDLLCHENITRGHQLTALPIGLMQR